MLNEQHISVVIPALDEQQAIRKVVTELRALRNEQGQPLLDDIVVCDNGSIDATALQAQAAGARVVFEPQRGYGAACLKAIAALGPTDIVLFVDGDDSCPAPHAAALVAAVANAADQGKAGAQLAIGSRTLGHAEPGALTPPQRFGNWLAACLIRRLWQARVTDLGPYRAIRRDALQQLHMSDRGFGWTIEMQIKAIQLQMPIIEVAVNTRRRIGQSKISGTVRGVIGAAHGIIGTLCKLRWQQSRIRAQLSLVERSPRAGTRARQSL